MAGEANPAALVQVFWKVAKYLLFPVGFLLLLLRVMARLVVFWFNKEVAALARDRALR